jgi:hypothetical protein
MVLRLHLSFAHVNRSGLLKTEPPVGECIGDLALIDNRRLVKTGALSFTEAASPLERLAAISSLDVSQEKLANGATGDRTDYGVFAQVSNQTTYLRPLALRGNAPVCSRSVDDEWKLREGQGKNCSRYPRMLVWLAFR